VKGPIPGKPALVNVVLAGKELVAQWDGASPYTFVGPQFLQILREQGVKIYPWEDVVRTASGEPFSVMGWAKVVLKLPGKQMVHPVVIAESLAQPCLLGADLMDTHGAIVLFRSAQWYWGDAPGTRFPFFVAREHEASVNLLKSTSLREKVNRARLTSDQREALWGTLEEFPEVFKDEPGRTSLVEHHIDTGSHPPVADVPYRMPPLKMAALDKILDEMLERGQIVPSQGPWASSAFLRPKADGGWRLCINYQRLNDITVKDKYPIPRLDELVDIIGQPKFITTFDLRSGYWQVPLDESSQEKAAFICPRGLFKPKVLMFGLNNAPATFQRLVNHLMLDLQARGVVAYIDDIVIASADFESHLQTIREVLARLKGAGLTINTDKVQVCQPESKVLGVVISSEGVRVDPDKVGRYRK